MLCWDILTQQYLLIANALQSTIMIHLQTTALNIFVIQRAMVALMPHNLMFHVPHVSKLKVFFQ